MRAQADQWKLYPCETLPWTVIKKWYDEGSYVPYSEEELVRVLIAEGAPRATRAGMQACAPLSCTRTRERAREQGAGMGLRPPHMQRRAPHLHAGTLLSRLSTVSGRGRFRLAHRPSQWRPRVDRTPSVAPVLRRTLRVKARVHPWIRLNRVIRDIPSQCAPPSGRVPGYSCSQHRGWLAAL